MAVDDPAHELMVRYLQWVRSTTRAMNNDLLWYRGQPKQKDCPLVPRVFRASYDEQNLIYRFQLGAVSRREHCPPAGDHVAWLVLAQHHGLPTRLLDWTISPLIALFFALRGKENGVVFALHAARLNQAQNATVTGPLMPRAKELSCFFADAVTRDSVRRDQALAFRPEEIDPRLFVQGSAFTIHGSSHPIERIARQHSPNLGPIVADFPIPASGKNGLRDYLLAVGISSSTLFPDLDHLAGHLSERA